MCAEKLKPKGVFLDLDGTIVDSRQAYFEAAHIAFSAVGKDPPEMKVALEIPRRLEQGLALKDITETERKKFVAIYLKAYYSLTLSKTSLMPQVSATLQNLSQKAKIALITMRSVPKEILAQELRQFDIAQHFSCIITAKDVPKPKPSPEGLFVGSKIMGVSVRACVIAGDSVNDIRAGKLAGAKTVAVLSGLYDREELSKENPDLILPDVSKLPNFIE